MLVIVLNHRGLNDVTVMGTRIHWAATPFDDMEGIERR